MGRWRGEHYILRRAKFFHFADIFDDPVVVAIKSHNREPSDIFTLLDTEHLDALANREMLVIIMSLANDRRLLTSFLDASPHCVELFSLWERTEAKLKEGVDGQERILVEKILSKLLVVVAIVIESTPHAARVIIEKVLKHMKNVGPYFSKKCPMRSIILIGMAVVHKFPTYIESLRKAMHMDEKFPPDIMHGGFFYFMYIMIKQAHPDTIVKLADARILDKVITSMCKSNNVTIYQKRLLKFLETLKDRVLLKPTMTRIVKSHIFHSTALDELGFCVATKILDDGLIERFFSVFEAVCLDDQSAITISDKRWCWHNLYNVQPHKYNKNSIVLLKRMPFLHPRAQDFLTKVITRSPDMLTGFLAGISVVLMRFKEANAHWLGAVSTMTRLLLIPVTIPPVYPLDQATAASISPIAPPNSPAAHLSSIIYPTYFDGNTLARFVNITGQDLLAKLHILRLMIALLRRVKCTIAMIRGQISRVELEEGAGARQALSQWQAYLSDFIIETKARLVKMKVIQELVRECRLAIKTRGIRVVKQIAKDYNNDAMSIQKAYQHIYHHVLRYITELSETFPDLVVENLNMEELVAYERLDPLTMYQLGEFLESVISNDLMAFDFSRLQPTLDSILNTKFIPNKVLFTNFVRKVMADTCRNNLEETNVWIHFTNEITLQFVANAFSKLATEPFVYMQMMETAINSADAKGSKKNEDNEVDFTPLIMSAFVCYSDAFVSVGTKEQERKRKQTLKRREAKRQRRILSGITKPNTTSEDTKTREAKEESEEEKEADVKVEDTPEKKYQRAGIQGYICSVLVAIASAISARRSLINLLTSMLSKDTRPFTTLEDFSFLTPVLNYCRAVDGDLDAIKDTESKKSKSDALVQIEQLLEGEVQVAAFAPLLSTLPVSEFPKVYELSSAKFASQEWQVTFILRNPDYPIWDYSFIQDAAESGESSALLDALPLSLLISHAMFGSTKGRGVIYLDNSNIRNSLQQVVSNKNADALLVETTKQILGIIQKEVPDKASLKSEKHINRVLFLLEVIDTLKNKYSPPLDSVVGHVHLVLLSHPTFRILFEAPDISSKIVDILFLEMSEGRIKPSNPNITFYLSTFVERARKDINIIDQNARHEGFGLQYFCKFLPYLQKSTIEEVLTNLLTLPHTILLKPDSACCEALRAILSFAYARLALDYRHPLFKWTIVSTSAPQITPGSTPSSPFELTGVAFGALLRIAMDAGDAFYGKRLVRAFLKNILFSTSDFVPHVPENFVEFCLANPTDAMSQILSILLAVSSYHRTQFAEQLLASSESESTDKIEYLVTRDTANQSITPLIYPIYTFVASTTSKAYETYVTDLDIRAMRAIAEVALSLVLPHVLYPTEATQEFSRGSVFLDKFSLHKLIGKIVLFCHKRDMLAPLFAPLLVFDLLQLPRSFTVGDLTLSSSIVNVLLEVNPDQKKDGTNDKGAAWLQYYISKSLKDITQEMKHNNPIFEYVAYFTKLFVETNLDKEKIQASTASVFLTDTFDNFVAGVALHLRKRVVVSLLDLFLRAIPSEVWKTAPHNDKIKQMFTKLLAGENFVNTLRASPISQAPASPTLECKHFILQLLETIHVHCGYYCTEKDYFLELQRAYFGTMHPTDQTLLHLFQSYQVNASFGFGNTCFVWGEAALEHTSARTPTEALQLPNIINAELLTASIEAKLPEKAFNQPYTRPVNALEQLKDDHTSLSVQLPTKQVVYDPTFILPFFEAAVTPDIKHLIVTNFAICYIIRGFSATDPTLRKLAENTLAKYIQRAEAAPVREVTIPLMCLRKTYANSADSFSTIHTEFISRAIRILHNTADPLHSEVYKYFIANEKLRWDIPLWDFFNPSDKNAAPYNAYFLDYFPPVCNKSNYVTLRGNRVFTYLMGYYNFDIFGVSVRTKILAFFAEAASSGMAGSLIDDLGLFAWLSAVLKASPGTPKPQFHHIVTIFCSTTSGNRAQHRSLLQTLLSTYNLNTASSEDVTEFFFPILRHCLAMGSAQFPLLDLADLSRLTTIYTSLSSFTTIKPADRKMLIGYIIQLIVLSLNSMTSTFHSTLSSDAQHDIVTLVQWCCTALSDFSCLENTPSNGFLEHWISCSACFLQLAKSPVVLPVLLQNDNIIRVLTTIYGLRDLFNLSDVVMHNINGLFLRILTFLRSLDPSERSKYYHGRLFNDASKDANFKTIFDEKLPALLKGLPENARNHREISMITRYFFDGAPIHRIILLLEK